MQAWARVLLLSIGLTPCCLSFHTWGQQLSVASCRRASMTTMHMSERHSHEHVMTKSPRKATATGFLRSLCTLGVSAVAACPMFLAPVGPAYAISGGGKDYAEAKISGQNFNAGDYSGKDFSGAFAQQTTFVGAKLRGARFYKASLKEADFTGADLTGASLENASLDDVILKDAVVQGAYFSQSLLKVGNIEGADFTDSLVREDVQARLCGRPDAKGVNTKTKVSTRESLMCE